MDFIFGFFLIYIHRPGLDFNASCGSNPDLRKGKGGRLLAFPLYFFEREGKMRYKTQDEI